MSTVPTNSAPVKPSDTERERRWNAIGDVMRSADVGAVIGNSDLGDQNPYQRYMSGYRSTFDNIASVLFESGDSVMVVANPGVVMFAKQLSWIEDVVVGAETKPWLVGDSIDKPVVSGASIGEELGEQLRKRGIKRVGLAGMELFPGGWRDAILSAVPDCVFVDLRPGFDRLRMTKSAEEIENIRIACRISDEIWADMANIVRVGRRECEVMAELEERIRSAGGEDSYNMFFPLPMFSEPVESHPSTKLVEAGATYLVEVSPRFAGYYGQQTGLVSCGPAEPEAKAVLAAINRARDRGMELMRPGNDLTDVVKAIDQQLTAEGYELSSPLVGHFVGMQLEEPRAGAASLKLEPGMVFICHPFANGWPAYMRADTFLVTTDGVERLTTQPLEPLEL